MPSVCFYDQSIVYSSSSTVVLHNKIASDPDPDINPCYTLGRSLTALKSVYAKSRSQYTPWMNGLV